MGIKYIHLVSINLIGPFERTMVQVRRGCDENWESVCSRMEGGKWRQKLHTKMSVTKLVKYHYEQHVWGWWLCIIIVRSVCVCVWLLRGSYFTRCFTTQCEVEHEVWVRHSSTCKVSLDEVKQDTGSASDNHAKLSFIFFPFPPPPPSFCISL